MMKEDEHIRTSEHAVKWCHRHRAITHSSNGMVTACRPDPQELSNGHNKQLKHLPNRKLKEKHSRGLQKPMRKKMNRSEPEGFITEPIHGRYVC